MREGGREGGREVMEGGREERKREDYFQVINASPSFVVEPRLSLVPRLHPPAFYRKKLGSGVWERG